MKLDIFRLLYPGRNCTENHCCHQYLQLNIFDTKLSIGCMSPIRFLCGRKEVYVISKHCKAAKFDVILSTNNMALLRSRTHVNLDLRCSKLFFSFSFKLICIYQMINRSLENKNQILWGIQNTVHDMVYYSGPLALLKNVQILNFR